MLPFSSPKWSLSASEGNMAHPSSVSHIDSANASMPLEASAAAALSVGPAQISNMRTSPLISASLPVGSSTETVTNDLSIFVGDLPPSLHEEDLVDQFLHPPPWPPGHPCLVDYIRQHPQEASSREHNIGPSPFTSIKGAKIMTDPITNVSRGYGFVRFHSSYEAQRALTEMDGVYISPYDRRSQHRLLRVSPAVNRSRTLFSSIPSGTSPVPHSFPSFATTAEAMPRDDNAKNMADEYKSAPLTRPGRHLGLEHHSSAAADLSGPDPTGLTSFSGPSGSNARTPADAIDSPHALDPRITTVFVGGLSPFVTEGTLKSFFSPFGKLSHVKIPPGLGCGFVVFQKKSDAAEAIEKMQGFRIAGSSIRLSWGRLKSESREVMPSRTPRSTTSDLPPCPEITDGVSSLAIRFGLRGLDSQQLSSLTELLMHVQSQTVNGRKILELPTDPLNTGSHTFAEVDFDRHTPSLGHRPLKSMLQAYSIPEHRGSWPGHD